MPYTFDFAISFSRECRSEARQLAKFLEDQGAVVFYDRSFSAHLLGKPLDDEFPRVFGRSTRFFVPFVSAAYARRPWPQYEWAIAKLEATRRQDEFILPLRVDDSLLLGLPDTIGYLDLREVKLSKVSDILISKLESSTTKVATRSEKGEWVVTFGVNLEELDGHGLPPETPLRLPRLYDWLLKDLMKRLAKGSWSVPQIIEDSRTGETQSVRMTIEWDPSMRALDFGEMAWWELLEFTPYDAMFGDGEVR